MPELVLRCDYDDVAMIDFARRLGAAAPERNRLVVGPSWGYAGLAPMTNEAALVTRGDLILCVSDDAEFVTPDWDALLLAEAAKYPDGIFVLGVDTLNAKNFPFPCVSRRVMQTIGCFFDERLIYTDIWIRDVLASVGRAIRVPHVTIRHNWAGMSDDQKHAAERVKTPEYQKLYDRCVSEASDKLKRIM